MAKLNFKQKAEIEELFGMGSGYVLNFSNRTFQEFIYDILGIDVYVNYTGLSKAKMLREIIKTYNDKTIGELLVQLLEYGEATKAFEKQDKLYQSVLNISKELIYGKNQKQEKKEERKESPKKVDYSIWQEKLIDFTKNDSTSQNKGFKFEKLLKELFEFEGLEPRGSFKIVGEQIDGSFILNGHTYLLEAKWTNSKISKSDLVVFNEKVSSKSAYTRGLFISYSGYTEEALQTFAIGRTVRIILLSVDELAIAFERNMKIKDLISTKMRFLAEEGDFYKHIYKF